MNKLILAASISFFSFSSFASSGVDSSFTASCKTGGCEYICTTQSGKQYIKEKDIKLAKITNFSGGTINAYFEKSYTNVSVSTPAGTESCKLTNIKDFMQ